MIYLNVGGEFLIIKDLWYLKINKYGIWLIFKFINTTKTSIGLNIQTKLNYVMERTDIKTATEFNLDVRVFGGVNHYRSN